MTLLLFYSCDEENKIPDEIQKQLIDINFNTASIEDIGIHDMNIFLFDEDGRYVDSKYFANVDDLQNLDFSELSFVSGKQTVMTIFNTGANFIDNHLAQLTKADMSGCSIAEFTNAINELFSQGTIPDMLTGSAVVDVVGGTLYVTIEIFQQPITVGVTELTLRLHYPDSEYVPYSVMTKSEEDLKLRVLAEVYLLPLDEPIRFASFVGEPNSDGQYQFRIPLVTDVAYEVRLWSDYAADPYTDMYYNTTDTKSIKVQPKEDYEGNNYLKDAFVNYQKSYSIKGGGEPQSLDIEFYRPVALYEIVATDVDKYNAEHETNGNPPIEELMVEVHYQGYLPTGYDMTKPDLNDADTGYSYCGQLDAAEGSKIKLASDYVMTTEKGSHVIVNVVIKDIAGRVITTVKGVKIQYKAACLTTISGDFLTAGEGGISIDTEWSGDHIVNF